jgi:peptidoglycan hydrolase-like protein with peptidoglycan-binding domain
MVVFAASPGQVAYDGGEGNSPFAKALARHLPAENVEVLSLMKRVIADVKRETGERQVPMVTNDLTREIYLRLGEGSPGAALAAQQEQAMFDAALALNTPRAWDLFLQRHPNGGLRDMAVLAREGLTAARLAEASEVEADEDGRISVSREVARTEEEGLGLSREDARAVQAALNARGYDAGPEDGQIGTRTRRAVADFQAAAGLPSTGVVTAGTAGALGLELVASESRSAPVISSPNARRYDPDVLAQVEDDPRLLKAVRVLEGKEFVYGFYEGRLYIGLLTWAHESFDEAQARAERAGGYLAALTTEAENAFAFDLVKDDRRFWWNCGECPDRFGPAFGLYQIEDAREPDGGFVWVTGEPVAFTAWNPGEPGNHNGNEYFATFHWQAWAHRTGAPSHASERWGDLPDSGKSILIEIE